MGPSFWPSFPALPVGLQASSSLAITPKASDVESKIVEAVKDIVTPTVAVSTESSDALTAKSTAAPISTAPAAIPSSFGLAHPPLDLLLGDSRIGTLTADDVLGVVGSRSQQKLSTSSDGLRLTALCLAHCMRSLRHRTAGVGHRMVSPILLISSALHRAISEAEALRSQLDRERANVESKSDDLKKPSGLKAEASPMAPAFPASAAQSSLVSALSALSPPILDAGIASPVAGSPVIKPLASPAPNLLIPSSKVS